MAIKRITVEQSGNLLTAIDKHNKDFGITTDWAKVSDRDKCIIAEVIIDAVDAHRAANRKPREKKAEAEAATVAK